MGFPVPYGPKLLIIAGILIAVLNELWRSLLELLGLCDESFYSSENSSLSADNFSMNYPPGIIPSAIRASLFPLPFDVLLEQCPDKCLQDSDCAVCLSEFMRGQAVQVMPNCSHVFHRVCIDQWLDQDQMTCPLCRRSLASEKIPLCIDQKMYSTL